VALLLGVKSRVVRSSLAIKSLNFWEEEVVKLADKLDLIFKNPSQLKLVVFYFRKIYWRHFRSTAKKLFLFVRDGIKRK